MSLLSTYRKEMKIAFRGFYFYIELLFAVIVLIILLVAVKENPEGSGVEYIYNDMSIESFEALYRTEVAEGRMEQIEDTELTIKPSEFTVLDKETGEKRVIKNSEKKSVIAQTYKKFDTKTGKVRGTTYVLDNEEDMLLLSYNTGDFGGKVILDDAGQISYEYYLQGFETKRFEDALYVIHTYSTEEVNLAMENQEIKYIGNSGRLNAREAVVPVFITFSGALMGIFIIMAYIFLDKSEGVIKAIAVTPASVWSYLLSKILIMLTTVIISSSIVVIPIMKLKPNYLLFYLFLIASSFAFSAFGLLVSSFYDSITKAFGVLYLIMITLMLPVFPYYIGSFDPVWIRFLPTYPLLEGLKGIMRGQANIGYVLTYTGLFLIGGFVILALANNRFKKSLIN